MLAADQNAREGAANAKKVYQSQLNIKDSTGELSKDYASAGRIDTLGSIGQIERNSLQSRVKSELKMNSIRSQSNNSKNSRTGGG